MNTNEHSSITTDFSIWFDALAGYLEDGSNKEDLIDLFSRLDEGAFDDDFRQLPAPDRVHLTTSCHLLCLTLRHRLFGTTAEDFYKTDARRYVRTNLLVQKVMGISRMTLGWPVYAFGAEIMGQNMMYPEDHAPGADPGDPLISLDRIDQVPDFDPTHPLVTVTRDMLLAMHDLSGIEPAAHLPAPYSLAAEVIGQEHLILALSSNREAVARLLNVLAERVLAPWCQYLHEQVENVWLELSDASGSPMFVGPTNFLEISVPPVKKLRANPDWGDRVMVANYRGDSVLAPRTRSSRRSGRTPTNAPSLDTVLEGKRMCSPYYITRLEADSQSVDEYLDFALNHNLSTYFGIGAVLADRNSISDREAHLIDLDTKVSERVRAAHQAMINQRDTVAAPIHREWPGGMFLEDTNSETDLRVVRRIIDRINDQ